MARKGEVDVELNSGAYPRAEAECFLCKERSERIVFREAGYEAHQCDCGLLYTTPLPPPDAIDLTEDLHKKAYYDLPAALRVEFIKRYRPTGDLLEVGCGDGFFLRAAQSQGYNVAAIEPNPERAAQVRQALGVQVEEAYIETSNWPPQSFDIIYHCDMLSHFPDPVYALGKMKSLLKPGGVLYFEVGLVGGLSPHWYRRMGTLRMPHHRWFYTPDALNALLKASGLQVDRMKRFGLAPGILLSKFGKALGRGGGATRTLSSKSSDEHRPSESVKRQRARVALRYRIGALLPGIGPETAFVIASPFAVGTERSL